MKYRFLNDYITLIKPCFNILNGLFAGNINSFNSHDPLIKLIAVNQRFCLDPHFIYIDGFFRIL